MVGVFDHVSCHWLSADQGSCRASSSALIQNLLCRVLTAQDRKRYQQLISKSDGQDKLFEHQGWKLGINGINLATCAAGKWLSDPIVNMKMAVLQVRMRAHFTLCTCGTFATLLCLLFCRGDMPTSWLLASSHLMRTVARSDADNS